MEMQLFRFDMHFYSFLSFLECAGMERCAGNASTFVSFQHFWRQALWQRKTPHNR
jgi:hypothetical protein